MHFATRLSSCKTRSPAIKLNANVDFQRSSKKSTYISLFIFATKPHAHTLAQLSLCLGAHFFHNWIKPAKDNNFFISASRRLMRRPECSLHCNAEKYTRRCVVCVWKKNPHERYIYEISRWNSALYFGAIYGRGKLFARQRAEWERVGQKARNIYGAQR